MVNRWIWVSYSSSQTPRCCSSTVGGNHTLVEMYMRSCEAYTVSPEAMTEEVALGAPSGSSVPNVTIDNMSNPANSDGAWMSAQPTSSPSETPCWVRRVYVGSQCSRSDSATS